MMTHVQKFIFHIFLSFNALDIVKMPMEHGPFEDPAREKRRLDAKRNRDGKKAKMEMLEKANEGFKVEVAALKAKIKALEAR